MARCYYADRVTSRRHHGTLTRCVRCQKTICQGCVGRNLGDGRVLCFVCASKSIDSGRSSRNFEMSARQPPVGTYRSLRRSGAGRTAVDGIAHGFAGLAAGLLIVLGWFARPFHDRRDYPNSIYRIEGDLRFITERQRVLFVAAFAGVFVTVLVVGLVYAYLAEIPISRFLLAVMAATVAWGITSIYLRYLFAPLKEPFASAFAYVTSFFLALLLGGWLINREGLDRFLDIFQ